MSTPVPLTTGAADAPRSRSAGPSWVASARRNTSLLLGALALLVISLLTLVGPLVITTDPNFGNFSNLLAGPSSDHIFGTDNFGRDVFARVLHGYRTSMIVAIGSALAAVSIGLPLGLIAGYFGSMVDNVIMRSLDLLMAFPPILLAITLIAVYGTGTSTTILALAIIYIPIMARVIRASVISVRNEEFVLAAHAIGAHPLRIMLRHALPNSMGPLIVQVSISMGLAILIEAALSFIGLGTQPPNPSLGSMLAEGRDFMRDAPWVVTFPGLAIMFAVLAFNLLGDGLKESLNARRR
jgi:peptide/nickel transport system permease protein